MPAEVQSMFYVSNAANNRFKPWHGLGVAVDKAPTSKDALKLAGLDWKVIQHDVKDASSGIVLPGYRVNVRSNDNSVLGVVSTRYKIVQNEEAFDFTDNLINSGNVTYETAGVLFNGKKVWLLARMPAIKLLNDDVDPYICFTNSHDGSGAIKVCMTPTRVVCNNTLNLALSTAKRSWSTRHTGDMTAKMHEAQATLDLANNYMADLATEAQALYSVKIDQSALAKFIDLAFPKQENQSKTIVENRANNIAAFNTAMNQADLANFTGTGWQLVNAVADFTSHQTANRQTPMFNERKFDRVLNGHSLLDLAYDYVKSI